MNFLQPTMMLISYLMVVIAPKGSVKQLPMKKITMSCMCFYFIFSLYIFLALIVHRFHNSISEAKTRDYSNFDYSNFSYVFLHENSVKVINSLYTFFDVITFFNYHYKQKVVKLISRE